MPTLAEQLLAAALEARRRAEEAASDEKAARERREKYEHVAAMLESQMAGLEEEAVTTETVLHKSGKQSTVNAKDMVSEHRVAISKGGHKGDSWLRTIRKAGYSQNALAEKIGGSASLLSKHRLPRGNPNSRPITQERADLVKELTGWPADAAHWPAGIA